MSDDTPTGRFNPDAGNHDAVDPPTRRLPQQRSPQQSDDAPTERFAAPGNDAPTERFRSSEPEVPVFTPRPSPPPAPPGRGNAPLIATVIGTILVAALAVLLLVLATRGNDGAAAPAPSVSESPTAEPSEAPAPEPEPEEEPAPAPAPAETPEPAPAQGAMFSDFSPADNSTVSCPDETSSVPLSFAWQSAGAEAAWFGVATSDAKARPLAEVETSGTFEDISFECANESEVYTVTLDDGAGTLTHATVTLVRQLP